MVSSRDILVRMGGRSRGSMRLSDLQSKDIVNVLDGRNIGNIIDVKIDEKSGAITALVVEPSKKVLSFMSRGLDTEIAWQNIERIGEDVILVRFN